MNMGDKAVALGCLCIVAGWAGYELRDAQAEPPIHCSAWLDDGRALLNTITEARGRMLCIYSDSMPKYAKRKGART